MLTDAELYQRGFETLIASREAYADCASVASVRRLPGVTTPIFPCEPERGIYNNAVLTRDLNPRARVEALTAMQSAYAAAGVGRVGRVGPKVGRVDAMRAGATRLHRGQLG